MPPTMLLALCALVPQADARVKSPVERVLDEFERAPLVGLAEQHRRAEVHAFLLELVAAPRFGRVVDDVVVEFGNALYQPVVDRYLAGEDVPADELAHVWRDTGQWLVWDSPLYAAFFERLRALNLARPAEERVRILLGDPPIDWPKVASADDYRKFAERDAFFAALVEREVLAKDRRALLVAGSMHLPKRDPSDPSIPRTGSAAATLLETRNPGALRVVWTLPPSAELAQRLGFTSAPAFLELENDPLGEQSYGLLVPEGLLVRVGGEWKPMGAAKWPPMHAMVDALLYLGPDEHLVAPDPALYRDPDYQRELRRRAPILQAVYGMDFLPELEELLASSGKPGG